MSALYKAWGLSREVKCFVLEETKAFCLHRRPYRETSLIVELFTKQYGRIAAIAKGVRRRNQKQPIEALLQPFRPLTVRLSGKSELRTLVGCEQSNSLLFLRGTYLYAGLYLNELLVRLLPVEFVYSRLFAEYDLVLRKLAEGKDLTLCLRDFEFNLLSELGYGIPFVEVDAGGEFISDEFSADENYIFQQDSGFIRSASAPDADPALLFQGENLNRLARREFKCESDLAAAKKLTRLVIRPLLGYKPLQSRQLFL